jgi:hypothetical protein
MWAVRTPAAAVLNFANAAETPAAGGNVQGNIVWDSAALVRRYNAALTNLQLNDNLLPVAWTGPGANNVVGGPGTQARANHNPGHRQRRAGPRRIRS